MGKIPKRNPLYSRASLLYKSPSLVLWQFPLPFALLASNALFTPLVSSDTAIAIAFGLLSNIIGLLGVFVGYLTLRAMPLGMQLLSFRDLLPRPSSEASF